MRAAIDERYWLGPIQSHDHARMIVRRTGVAVVIIAMLGLVAVFARFDLLGFAELVLFSVCAYGMLAKSSLWATRILFWFQCLFSIFGALAALWILTTGAGAIAIGLAVVTVANVVLGLALRRACQAARYLREAPAAASLFD